MAIPPVSPSPSQTSQKNPPKKASLSAAEIAQNQERMRELKKAQDQEYDNTAQDGRQKIEKTREHYQSDLYQTERQGDHRLQELQIHQKRKLDLEEQKNRFQLEELKNRNTDNLKQINESSQARIEKIHTDSETTVQTLKASSIDELQRIKGNTEKRYEEVLKEEQEILQRVKDLANKKIEDLESQNSKKIAVYQSMMDDPFYSNYALNTHLQELSDAFLLTATIPEHEQSNISVSVKGDSVILSGNRRNELKTRLDDGRWQGTSSYQTYYERIPLSYPVDAKKMTRDTQGNQVIIRIPKIALTPSPKAPTSSQDL